MESLQTIFMFLYLSSFGQITSMPPLPEDPVLDKIAPQECLIYFSWAGGGKADPQSKNKTEQLLADEEVRVFIDGIKKRIADASIWDTALQGQSKEEKEAVQAMLQIASIAMKNPAAGFVSDMQFKKQEPEKGDGDSKTPLKLPAGLPLDGLKLQPQLELAGLEGAFVFNAGKQSAQVRQAFAKILQVASQQEDFKKEDIKEITVAGVKMHTVKSKEGLEGYWGTHKTYFFFAVGRPAVETLVAGLQNKRGPPKWLTDARLALDVPRPAFRWYVDIQRVVNKIKKQSDSEEFSKAIEAIGLNQLQSVASVTGLDERAVATKTLYRLQGDSNQYLQFLSQKPLTLKDLRVVPADATFAFAGQFDFEILIKSLESLEKSFPQKDDEEEPDAFGLKGRITAEQKKLMEQLSKEVASALGPTWCLYNAPSDGGFLFTGLTAVVDVKDPGKLRRTLEKIVVAAKATGMGYTEFDFRGHKVYYLSPGADIKESIFSPAWCIADNKLVWAMYPQVVKSYLSRRDDERTLADVPVVKALLDGKTPPQAMAYFDTQRFYRGIYSIAQIGIPFLGAGLKQIGVDYPIHEIPSAAVIRNYIRPGITSIRRDRLGIVVESHKSLPFGSGLFGMFVLMGAWSEQSFDVPINPLQGQQDFQRAPQGKNNTPFPLPKKKDGSKIKQK